MIIGNLNTKESIAILGFSHLQKSSNGSIPITQKLYKKGETPFPIRLKLVLPGRKIRKAPIIIKMEIAVNRIFWIWANGIAKDQAQKPKKANRELIPSQDINRGSWILSTYEILFLSIVPGKQNLKTVVHSGWFLLEKVEIQWIQIY